MTRSFDWADDAAVRSLLESAPDAMVVSNQQGEIVFVNSRAEELFAARREELIGASIETLVPERLRGGHVRHRAAYTAAPSVRAMNARGELRGRRLDGTEFPIEVNLAPINTPSGPVVAAAVRDITERRRIESEARESAERFAAAFQSSAIGMAIVDSDGRFLKANQALCGILGYPESELLELDIDAVADPEDRSVDAELAQQLRGGSIDAYHVEKRYRHREGAIVWVRLSASSVRDDEGNPLYSVTILEDITEARAASEELHRSLAEKEVLLREIHHRVKNNLQVVSSILELQAGRLDEPELQRLFRDSQARIRSMAMVHERLYRSGNLGRIDFGSHLHDLARLAVLARSGTGTVVELAIEVEPVELDIDRAIPLGLIANELLTNALRHAFVGREKGRLEVALAENDGLKLSVADDGVGLPAAPAPRPGALGLSLVQGLVRQLRATLESGPNGLGGARFVLTMPAIEGPDA